MDTYIYLYIYIYLNKWAYVHWFTEIHGNTYLYLNTDEIHTCTTRGLRRWQQPCSQWCASPRTSTHLLNRMTWCHQRSANKRRGRHVWVRQTFIYVMMAYSKIYQCLCTYTYFHIKTYVFTNTFFYYIYIYISICINISIHIGIYIYIVIYICLYI